MINSGRVLSVLLKREDDPKTWDDLGTYATIGSIKFEFTTNPFQSKSQQNANPVIALPLFSSLKHIPVTNEVVSIIKAAGPLTGESTIDSIYYYFPPINIWNTIHHNAIPEEVYNPDINIQPAQKKDYQQVGAGSVRRTSDNSTEINFGNGFEERLDVKNLQPYIGDLLLEGRWGNTLRFSSTTTDKSNNWSSANRIGDPIVILKNGQFTDTKNPAWVPQNENINLDDSSIYLTSTQKINIEPPIYLNYSYNGENTPEDPEQFTQPQILLNSNRVSLFSRESSLISAPNIHITGETGNIDLTGTFTVYANRVNLGSGNPNDLQPALKGDQTQALLDEILFTLKKLVQACKTATAGTVPVASLQKFALENIARIQKLDTSTIKSDDTFIV